MSARGMIWARHQKVGSPIAKALLILIAELCADGTNELFNSQSELSEVMEVDRKTITRNLGRLETMGFIVRNQRFAELNHHRKTDQIIVLVDHKFTVTVHEETHVPESPLGVPTHVPQSPDPCTTESPTRVPQSPNKAFNYKRTTSNNYKQPPLASVQPPLAPLLDDEPPLTPPSSSKEILLAEFNRWYSAYPKHQARGSAVKAFFGSRKKTDFATLMKSVETYKKKIQNEKIASQFIPMPATWLNQERWADEEAQQSSAKRQQIGPTAQEIEYMKAIGDYYEN